jgi:anaerobic ribonucleoside-triphosphate reductase activating protein
MGGDSEPSVIDSLAAYIREKYEGLKIAWYSGREKISHEVDKTNFDFIKIGPYIEDYGGLDKETTNQILFEVKDGKLIDITKKMQKGDSAE